MTVERVAASVEIFIRDRFRIAADDAWLTRQTNIWQDGVVDSIGVVELIGHIETTFGVQLPDEALFDPAFTSIEGIATIVSALIANGLELDNGVEVSHGHDRINGHEHANGHDRISALEHANGHDRINGHGYANGHTNGYASAG